MIKFSCKLCGEKLSVQDQLSGKRIKCPKCNNACVVPAESPTIKFACQNCGKGIRVLQIHAGKAGKCPKCKSPVAVPPISADPTDGSETVTVVCSMCNEKIRAPKGSQERFIECPTCGSNVESSLGAEPPEPDSSIPPNADEDEYEDEYDQPEEDEGPDRRLIFVIAGAAVVVVVGLIILITVILPSGSGPAEERQEMRQEREVADGDSSPQPDATDARPTRVFPLEPPKENLAGTEATISPAAASNAASNNALELRLQPGQKHRLRIISEEKVSLTMMGQRQDINSISTVGLEFEVEQIDANSIAWIKATYLTFREKGGSAAGQMEYDSTKPDDPFAPTYNAFAPTYSAMMGQSFVMKVTPEGKMVELKGIDEMYLRMAETIVEGEDETMRRRARERMADGAEERAERSIENLNQRYGSRKKREEAVSDLIKKTPLFTEEKIRGTVGNVIMPFPGGVLLR